MVPGLQKKPTTLAFAADHLISEALCDKVLVQCAYRVCNVSLYSPEPLLVPQRGPF